MQMKGLLKIFVWRGKSVPGKKGNMGSEKDGRSNDKCHFFWWFMCGFIDGFNEFMNIVCSRVSSLSSQCHYPVVKKKDIFFNFKRHWHSTLADVPCL